MIVRVRKTITDAFNATEWKTVALPELGPVGRILSVKARLDATDTAASAATVYIADGSATANAMAEGGSTLPEDGVVFYQSAATAFTGHAKTADLAEYLNGGLGAAYRVSGIPDQVAGTSDLKLGLLVTGTHAENEFTFYVDIVAEVY